MRIAKWYKLHKEGEFYFFYRDRSSFIPNDHATKLSSALCKLSKMPTQGSVNARSESANEKAFTQSVVPTKTTNEGSAEKVSQEEDSLALTNSSVAVQLGKEMPASDNVTTETAGSVPHDIQIHVQRPSPVREVPGSHQKLFSVGTVPDFKDDSATAENVSEMNTEATAASSEPAVSSLENIPSDVIVGRKVSDSVLQRVRPTSGPATVTCAERPEFSLVRKAYSVTNSLDEETEQVDFVADGRRSVSAVCTTTRDSAAARDSMQRIHSMVSFDRASLRSPQSSLDIAEAAELLTRSAPSSRTNHALRSRHTSGFETPMSALDTSSVTSMGEAGTKLLLVNNLHVVTCMFAWQISDCPEGG